MQEKEGSAAQTDTPLVTVGVPVYNGEKYLEGVFAALAALRYPNLEIFFSDNCSTDGTSALCAEFARRDPRVRVVRQDENIGPFRNFQYLLDHAKGKYFFWYSVDDGADPMFVDELVTVLEQNPTYSIAGCDVRIIDEQDAPLHIEKLANVRHERVERNWPRVQREFFQYNIDNRYLLIYCLFRTEMARQCSTTCFGHFRWVASSEIPFLAHLSCLGPAVAIEKALKIYRQNYQSYYQIRMQQRPPLGYVLRHYLNIWECLWVVLARPNIAWPVRIRIAAYLLASFPLYLARALKRDMFALLSRRPASRSPA